MSLAPPGTLARRRQQAGVDAACLKMKTCPHGTGEERRPTPRGATFHCVDCGALRAIYERQHGMTVRVWSADGA